MILGVLPAVGSGLDTMARAGQLGRVVEYMKAWRTRFGHVTYFSYLPWSDESAHADAIRRDCAVNAIGGPWPWHRAMRRPISAWGRQHWRGVSVLRCMNLLAAVPALTANAVWRTPFVVSLGADYQAIARIHGDVGQVWKWRLLRALVLRRAAAVIVPNPVQATRFQARYPRARIVHLPNWVDTNLFRPPATPWLGDGGKRVYYWGRLVEEKNLIRAARACRATGATLCCVGDGPEEDWLRRAGAAVIRSHAHEQLPRIMGIADAFILPSLSEGHPKALLEAMSLALPCLVSDRVEGIVEHERTGLVFGAEDEASMVTAVRRVLEEPGLAKRLGEAARTEAVTKYAKEPILEGEVALLREVAR